jgi:uncharacterized protein YjbI with pentapeptide repeats
MPRLRKIRVSPAQADKPAVDPTASDLLALPPESPAAPDAAQKFTYEADDLNNLRKAVEDAASVSAGLWLSYLFFLFYIGIAAGGITHRDLLLESPVKLPFLGVELPLVAFFFLAPVLFIVSHAYTLMHFVMLAAKVGVFDAELKRQLPAEPDAEEGIRRQLPSNIFVQFLAGPKDIREGKLGLFLAAVAWITLVIGPVLLLLLIQVQFLAYHLWWVTWTHRIAVLVDVVLLWLMWPAVLNGRSKLMWRLEFRGQGWLAALSLPLRYIAALTACLLPIGVAFAVATFPGEWLDEHIGNWQWIAPNRVTAWLGATDSKDQPVWTCVHDLLFNGEYDSDKRRRKSLFSNTLVLPDFSALEAAKIDNPTKLNSAKQTLALYGRHLEGAVFYRADLRKAYFGDAYLQGASFYQAQLQSANFYQSKLQGANLYQAKLQVASLDGGAELQGAWLDDAQLQGVLLDGAQLQGASLRGAHLQGASFQGAQLQGASLQDTELQGADFQDSKLVGTDIAGAAMWGANFKDATLAYVFFKDSLKERPISEIEFNALRAQIEDAPETEDRKNALQRIEKLKSGIAGREASVQETLENNRVDKSGYQRPLAEKLEGIACSGVEFAPYIVRGLILNDRIAETGPFAPRLIESILAPDCPASAALTKHDGAKLRTLAKEAQPSESKP